MRGQLLVTAAYRKMVIYESRLDIFCFIDTFRRLLIGNLHQASVRCV